MVCPFTEHYADRWAMAQTYLVTAAAKALVLWDGNIGRELGQAGLKEEAEVASEMRKDELLRDFRNRLTSRVGISCVKRARNGYLRRISLRLKLKTNTDVLVWRSRVFHRGRRFCLSQIAAMVHFWVPAAMTPQKGDVLDMSYPYHPNLQESETPQSPVKKNQTSLRHHEELASIYRGLDREYDVLPFVKLDNGSRSIEIRMESLEDTDAFLYLMDSYVRPEVDAEETMLLKEIKEV